MTKTTTANAAERITFPTELFLGRGGDTLVRRVVGGILLLRTAGMVWLLSLFQVMLCVVSCCSNAQTDGRHWLENNYSSYSTIFYSRKSISSRF